MCAVKVFRPVLELRGRGGGELVTVSYHTIATDSVPTDAIPTVHAQSGRRVANCSTVE